MMSIVELARQMTNVNLHTEGVCLLAALSGDTELIKRAFICKFRHFDEGRVTLEMAKEREDVAELSWALIRLTHSQKFCDDLREAF